jgi:hypothetical protein
VRTDKRERASERARARARERERERETSCFDGFTFAYETFSCASVCRHKMESLPRTAVAEHIPIRGCWSSQRVREKECAVCVFIIAVPITKLFAWGEGDSGGRWFRGGGEREREREREGTTIA